MSNKMLIDATHAEETRVVVVDGNKVEEFDFESENKRQLAGNIYLAKVTRVEPSLQAAFVDYAGNRHGFLAFSEIHPDYYQIPVADREALIAEEMAQAQAEAEEEEKPKRRRRSRAKPKPKAEVVKSDDEVVTADAPDAEESAPEESAADADAKSDTETAPEDGAEEPAETDAKDIPGMDVVELDDDDDGEKPYVAANHASETDETIESVADDDTAEEIRPRRKPRARRYKIQEVIKVRQILLVQVVKEERGNKGAALTTYLSLAGRYCVLMPNTARGGGISRKITNAADRKKLKEIANEIEVPQGAGLIIRTAGAKRTKTEIKRDYEYLQRLWEQIRALTLQSIAPAKIYEEGNLIKRSIRDLYNRDIDEVLVEGELGYRTAKDFMKMIMPSHAKNVKHYNEPMPLFARYQVESYLGGMFNPTVQLPSGGYIVIGVTEALVAIDVNSGRATKEGSIEQTATKTNLEAAEEVARQLRLRDLAGLIVIDFIDMEERKNNSAVEKRFKDRLKT
ncbi:MAG: ribonuclease E/G, partial [Silicimonas sp.]|nr:ribonuclease E/G [Silicimonas sp.]